MVGIWNTGLAALALAVVLAGPARAADVVPLPESSPFPESLTSTSDGLMFVSSISHGGVLKVAPDGSTAVFMKPGEHGTRSTFGLLADEKTGTLWVASNDASSIGLKGPSDVEGGWVKGLDLASGALKFSAQMPATPAIGNDFAVGEDGTLYVTNIAGNQIFRLKPDAKEFEIFLADDRLKGGLDGIAFGEEGALYVNTFRAGELFRIDMKAGAAGAITRLTAPRALDKPDGLRPIKGGFVMVENGGPLSRVTIEGDAAKLETLASFAGPTGVTVALGRIWVAEGQLARLGDLKTGGKLPSFQLRAVPLPKE